MIIEVKNKEEAEKKYNKEVLPILAAKMQELYNQNPKVYWKSLWHQAIVQVAQEGKLPEIAINKH